MRISSLITAYRKERNLSVKELVKGIGISQSELYRNIQDSKQWRLGDLNRVYEFLRIPEEERNYQE